MHRPCLPIPSFFPTSFITLAFCGYLVACSISPGLLHAQGSREDYERWSNYSQRTSGLVYRNTVEPHWFGEQDEHFWYRVKTGTDSHEFVLVDAQRATRRPAFDHNRLAEALREATGREVSAESLQLGSLKFSQDVQRCQFDFADTRWSYSLPAGPLSAQADSEQVAGAQEGLAPQTIIARSGNNGEATSIRFENRLDSDLDVCWVTADGSLRSYGQVAQGAAFELSTYAGHAWLLQSPSGEPVASFVAALGTTTAVVDAETPRPDPRRSSHRDRRSGRGAAAVSPDGVWRVEFDDHNVRLVATGSGEKQMVSQDGTEGDVYGGRVWWSPDSQHFVVMRTKPGDRREIHLIDSAPEDSIHGRLISVPYAKPGDAVDHPRPVLFDVQDPQPIQIDDRDFDNPFSLSDLHWHASSRSFSFLYNQRGHQRVRVIAVDSQSAQPRVMIDESSDTFVCYSQKMFLHRIDSTDEVIWMSERSGFNHLYLIDQNTGEVKAPITQGEWVVRGVERVDEQDRSLLISVSGIHADEDPYHLHLMRVGFDGQQTTMLTEGDGQHRWELSPNDRYLIDTFSRVDLPPVTRLRDAHSGALICELEQADAEALYYTGWQPPERFVAKGRDGQTDIHGIIVRPTNFDPQRQYPVLESIYAGPHSAFVPKSFGTHAELYKMAELGFVVVKIDGMGTSHRSKAFHDVCWKNLGDSGFPDRIAWIRAAAQRHGEMDLSRVGIWGGSAGGQSALRALLAHGDFYHAAAADCGCHDNRVDKIWWNEQWMGWPIDEHYQQQSNVTQAHRLQGDLLLIVGELDRNVDPVSTLQVVDALIKADKDFELLWMPGVGHGAAGTSYGARRQADFFVRQLAGKQPRH